ncbi:MAG: thermonuclease family protein [Oscillatoriales cyanobacterium SM2_2_1]|nr:thermonuclease family protein [Oscillatoriales cyanobacterium SM2_2_1]
METEFLEVAAWAAAMFLLDANRPCRFAVKFYDGDNLTIIQGGIKTKVQLACIDAPELKQPLGQRARRRLKGLVEGQPLSLKVQRRDRLGRYLAEVYADGHNVNEQLVREGLAYSHTGPYKGCEGYDQLQSQAQHQHLGLWLHDTPVIQSSPQQFRQQQYGNRHG